MLTISWKVWASTWRPTPSAFTASAQESLPIPLRLTRLTGLAQVLVDFFFEAG